MLEFYRRLNWLKFDLLLVKDQKIEMKSVSKSDKNFGNFWNVDFDSNKILGDISFCISAKYHVWFYIWRPVIHANFSFTYIQHVFQLSQPIRSNFSLWFL